MATNYNHIAYSRSADGKEGFTTNYPNLNLLDGTTSSDIQGTIPIGRDYYTIKILTPSELKNINGQETTGSVYIDATNSYSDLALIYYSKQEEAIKGNFIKAGSKGWSTVTRTLKNTVNSNFGIVMTQNATSINNLSYSSPKIEQGSISTPWMPHESEVTSKDYPTYIGTYTDENETSSTDPADYTWERMNYRIYLDGIAVAGSKLLSAKVENLKPDTSYTIQVKQVSGEEESDFSDSVTFKTNVQK